MPIRLNQEQVAQKLANRPQGQSPQDVMAALLRSGEVAQQDLDKWHLEGLYNFDPNKVIRAADWQRMTKGMTATAADQLAQKAYRSGLQVEGYEPPQERQRGFNQAMTRKDEPNALTHPILNWQWHTPAEKHDILDATGETLGGIVGTVAGGAASGGNPIVAATGAGVGAAAGKGLAHELGPKSDHQYDLADITKTLLLNGAADLGGSAVPYLARKVLTPRSGADQIVRLFGRLGIEPNMPTATGNEFLQSMLNGAGHVPFSRGIVERANARAYGEWEQYMAHVLDNIHPQNVTRDDLSRITRDAMDRARQTFNASMKSEVGNVADAVHPNPVTAQEAGHEISRGHAGNEQALRDFGKAEYPAWITRAENADADVDAANIWPAWKASWKSLDPAAREFAPDAIKDLSSEVHGLIPTYSSKTRRALDLIAGRMHADGLGGTYDTLSRGGKERAEQIAAAEGHDMAKHLWLDPRSAITLRSYIGERVANLDPERDGQLAHYLGKVKGGIDDAISRMPNGLADEYRNINAGYAAAAQATRTPAANGGEGNFLAREIRDERQPERLARRLTEPGRPSDIAAADTASRPFEFAGDAQNGFNVQPVAGAPRPLDKTGRLAVQNLEQESEKATAAQGHQRVSPGFINQHLLTPGTEDTYRPLMGDANYHALRDTARPANLEEETRLYGSDLAKAVDNPSQRADNTFNAMFPKRSTSSVVDENMSLLPDRAEGERAFAQDLVDSSRSKPMGGRFARATGNGVDGLVNPGTLEHNLNDYGDTVGHVLNPADEQDLREGVEGAKHLQEPLMHANTSNTAPTSMAMRILMHPAAMASAAAAGGAAVSPQHMIGGAIGAGVGALTSMGAAKALTSPTMARWATRYAKSSAAPMIERLGGALGQQAGIQLRIPPHFKPLPSVNLKGDDAPPPIPDDVPPPIPDDDAPPPIPDDVPNQNRKKQYQ